jgi:hypothetical protein
VTPLSHPRGSVPLERKAPREPNFLRAVPVSTDADSGIYDNGDCQKCRRTGKFRSGGRTDVPAIGQVLHNLCPDLTSPGCAQAVLWKGFTKSRNIPNAFGVSLAHGLRLTRRRKRGPRRPPAALSEDLNDARGTRDGLREAGRRTDKGSTRRLTHVFLPSNALISQVLGLPHRGVGNRPPDPPSPWRPPNRPGGQPNEGPGPKGRALSHWVRSDQSRLRHRAR